MLAFASSDPQKTSAPQKTFADNAPVSTVNTPTTIDTKVSRCLTVPSHEVPSPVYPVLHAHVYAEPMLFVHSALVSHVVVVVPAVHSSTSKHVWPSPAYPVLHAHVYEPMLFVHSALVSHVVVVPAVHSSTSSHAPNTMEYPVSHEAATESTVAKHVVI